MKTSLRLVCIAFSVLGTIFGINQATGQSIGDGYFANTAPVQGMTDINVAWPGRVWFQANLADQGLGYRGSYFTLGAKTHLGQDGFDGRWLLETRGHFGTEADNGGWFANIGLERVVSLHAAGAEVTTGIWFDWDEDLQGDFAHSLMALGANISVETENWKLNGNGYFPIGETNYILGQDCFLNNLLVTRPAIDSALQGFDAILLAKPEGLKNVNGSIGIGGYGYSSELVDSFGGIRGRFGMQINGGMIVQAELNHDNRFDMTGVVQLGWMFGAGARGTEYGFLGTDLEPTLRNDHVVRFQQDLQVAIDPDTGRAYNVYHVNNLASPGGNGSVERPFDNLAAAEAASIADDIIFVDEGDGTTRNMDQGIALKPGQLFLGDGVAHLIPLADGTFLELCNDVDGLIPSITANGGNAIDLASRNTVRGFNIDGDAGAAFYGIRGSTGGALIDGIIEDVNISGTFLDGILLENAAGNWTFARNNLRGSNLNQPGGLNGINIDSSSDPLGTFQFTDNVIEFWNLDGIRINDFDAAAISFVDNTTSRNNRNGISLTNHRNSLAVGSNILFLDSDPSVDTSSDNFEAGINLDTVSGNINFLNMAIRNNNGGGIRLVDVTTPLEEQQVFIGTSLLSAFPAPVNGTSIFEGNGTGAAIAQITNDLSLTGPNAIQQLTITNTTIDNGGSGIFSQVSGIGASLTTSIVDNLSISGNNGDGIQLTAVDGGNHQAVVTNTDAPLLLNGNLGDGVAMSSSGFDSIAFLDARVSNLDIVNHGGNAILAQSADNGQSNIVVSDIFIQVADNGIVITADNANSSAVSVFDISDIEIANRLTVLDEDAGLFEFDGVNDGIRVNVFEDSFADVRISDVTMENIVGIIDDDDATGFPDTAFGFGTGINVSAIGNIFDPAVDTRLRLRLTNNNILSFADAVSITAEGDAHILADVNSTFTSNQAAIVDGTELFIVSASYGTGIEIATTDDAEIFTRVQGNTLTDNALGINLDAAGGGITSVVRANSILGSDLLATNSASSNICLAMTQNNLTNNAILVNNAAPADFLFERNGLTVNAPTLVFVPNQSAFTIGQYSLICEPAIEAEELVFDGIFP